MSSIAQKIKEYISSGGDITTLTVNSIYPSLPALAVAAANNTTPDGETAVDNEIIYQMARDEKWKNWEQLRLKHKYDQVANPDQKNVLSYFRASAREHDMGNGYDMYQYFNKKLNDMLPDNASLLVVQAPYDNSGGYSDEIDLHQNVTIVQIPRRASGEDIVAPDAWLARALDTPVMLNGRIVASIGMRANGGPLIRVHHSPSFNTDSQFVNSREAWDDLARIIHTAYSLSAGALTTGTDVSEEDITLAKNTQRVIDIIKHSYSDGDRLMKEVQNTIKTAEDTIRDAMQSISNRTAIINEKKAEYKQLSENTMSIVTDNAIQCIESVERINQDMPVKSCTLEGSGKNTHFDITFHPFVFDGADHGLRCLDRMRLHLYPLKGEHPDAVLKWQRHDGYEYDGTCDCGDEDCEEAGGIETRCHPHIMPGSTRACWGTASGEIASSVGRGDWHGMMQWVYAWMDSVDPNDHITHVNRFPEATTTELGFQVPADAEKKEALFS